MITKAKIAWLANFTWDSKRNVKNGLACLRSSKTKYRPKNVNRKNKTLTKPGQEVRMDFTGSYNPTT